MKKDCVRCFGTGKREVDIGDSNDVEVDCDDCRGTGVDWDEATPEEKQDALNNKRCRKDEN